LSQHQRLVEIVRRHRPELLTLARDEVNTRWLTDDEAHSLSDVLLAVFLDHLGDADEPDAEAAAADDLVGLVEMQREAFFRDRLQ
jgi:hypothetical protein